MYGHSTAFSTAFSIGFAGTPIMPWPVHERTRGRHRCGLPRPGTAPGTADRRGVATEVLARVGPLLLRVDSETLPNRQHAFGNDTNLAAVVDSVASLDSLRVWVPEGSLIRASGVTPMERPFTKTRGPRNGVDGEKADSYLFLFPRGGSFLG